MVVRCSRFVMGRRGWTKVEVPDGWLQVIRGPRPRSEKWPLLTGPRSAAPPSKAIPRQPRADHHTQQPKHQPGLRTSGLRPFTDPATKVSDAKERVVKLERALAAMVPRSTQSGKLWTVPRRQLKVHRSRHRSEIANSFWSASRKVPRDWNL